MTYSDSPTLAYRPRGGYTAIYGRARDTLTAPYLKWHGRLIAARAAFAPHRRRKPLLSRLRRKPLLTANEVDFFGRLRRALPGFHVFPQVSFAAILTDDGQLSRNAQWTVRAKFDRKIADFVICERNTLNVVAVVELDDRMHNRQADRQRDAITKAAGYQTIRYQSRQKPSEAEIADLFKHARAWVNR